ncbi:hypothetical protein JW960_08090 [candidate division KSB1 bacterium]|nr:hypothetical protein [candidate division KSB1 bacterium]
MNQQQQNTNIDVREYLQIFWRRKWFFIIPFIIGIIGGITYSMISKPVYQSSSVVRINQEQLLSGAMRRLVPGVTAQEQLNNLRRLITSHAYLKRLIQTLDLYKDPLIQEMAAKQKQAFPDLSTEEIIEMIWMERFSKMLVIKQQGSDFIQIAALGSTPTMAYNFAYTLTQIFIDESLRREVGGIRGALEFSSEQMSLYKQKLEESEERLRKFQEGVLQEDVNNQSIFETNIEQVRSMLTSVSIELRESNDRLNNINAELSSYNIQYRTPVSSTLQSLKAQLLESILEMSRMMLTYSWNDINIVRTNTKIENFRDRIRREIERDIKSQYQESTAGAGSDLIVQKEIILMDIDFLRRKKDMLNNTISIYRESMSKAPTRDLTLSRLQQEVNGNREIYQMLLQQTRGSEIEEALQRSAAENKFTIVEPAIKPLKPIAPNKIKLTLMGIVAGAAIGAGLIFLLEYMDKSFKKVEDVEKYLGLPVLGTIPKLEIDEIKF